MMTKARVTLAGSVIKSTFNCRPGWRLRRTMIKVRFDVFLFEPPSGRFFYIRISAVLLESVVERLVECPAGEFCSSYRKHSDVAGNVRLSLIADLQLR